MGKPQSQRTHGAKAKAANANLSPKEIRANKCIRTKQRNEARKAENIEKMKAIPHKTLEQKVAFFAANPNGYARERAKVAKKLATK